MGLDQSTVPQLLVLADPSDLPWRSAAAVLVADPAEWPRSNPNLLSSGSGAVGSGPWRWWIGDVRRPLG